MINLLKKLAIARKANRLANRRKANNREQLKAIYEGLIERGY